MADDTVAVLTHPSLLVVDEIGYLPINHAGAVLFFQLMNRRYECASTVLTSNKGFEQWGEVLGDDVMAAALIDRVLHHCHLVNIRGNSYRMHEHTELHRALLQSEVEDSAEVVRRPRKSRRRVTEARSSSWSGRRQPTPTLQVPGHAREPYKALRTFVATIESARLNNQ